VPLTEAGYKLHGEHFSRGQNRNVLV